jgi:hypothetical protein
VFDNCKEIITHKIDFLPLLPEALNFLEATCRVVDLSVLTKDCGLSHHFFDIVVDGEKAVEDLARAFGGGVSFVLDSVEVLLGLLFDVLEAAFNPG